MTAELPPDVLLYKILPRLPAKSALRFKFVSKQWHSFLSTPLFRKMHQHHVTNHHPQNPQKLLFISSMTPRTFHTLDCEAPDLEGLTAGRSLPFKVGSGNMAFITSCNGLVCVGITKSVSDVIYYSDLILWNPLTCDYKTLSKANYDKEDYWVSKRPFGLYHSASEDDYKLLHVPDLRNACIYSLKSDSWSEVEYSKDFTMPYYETWGTSIILNEKLYFLGKSETGTLRRLSYSIIRFDTKNENFTKIATPCLGDINTVCSSSTLLEKDGKVHLCVIYSSKADSTESGAKLWRMDEDGDWTMVGTYPIPKSFYSYEPLHLMRDGNWLTRCRTGCHAFKLDPARNFKNVLDSNTTCRISIPPRGKYIETLMSPNR